MTREVPNKPEPANPAMASGSQAERQWRGVAEPKRWTLTQE